MSRTVEALQLDVLKLQKELHQTKKTLEATCLENARLMAEAQNDREQLQYALVLTGRTASVSGACSSVQEAGDPMFSPSPPSVPFVFWRQDTQAFTTGPKLVYNNNATEMTYRDIGTRVTGTSHMMFECEEHTVRPAMSSNVNQHLTGRHSEGVGWDATGM